ncbi:unnamed protein product [Brassicogethes aeneus]|uniref:4-hydroxyphenylpyruvate dioxygenase n=1 Tax=Brassicogethes aeneus TaxID=1431903 RepID=A0A9P0FH40_BRAAE|nr:unnamed protein product [Brassicogethes aeneus]
MAASYYVTRLGFQPVAYKGLETGSRKYAGHVVQQNDITLLFISAYEPNETELGSYLAKHGDEIKDVAFAVDNLENIVNTAKARGAKVVKNIWEESDDDGTVRLAIIQTFGENTHTFIDRSKYKGLFLPGYVPCGPDALGMKLFWSVDDKDVQTKYSSLRSTIMSNWEENIKVINLKERGMEFLQVPDSYYKMLKDNLKTCNIDIQEDLNVLQELKILVDYDENGYLLQIFTKNMQDRPTLFIELIQRRNHNGFGAANFRALFEAIEMEQAKRGNLN